MTTRRHFARISLAFLAIVCSAWAATTEVMLKDVSQDKPLVLDQNADYHLINVHVAGLVDCPALTLAGRIRSITIERSGFGRVWSGMEGKAAAVECAGAMVGRLIVRDSSFFDTENQLVSLKDGSFGRVTFERCRFSTSAEFLKEAYTANPWRTTPPNTEFYNIDRLELLDSEFVNTTVVIHPSVKQVIIRGGPPSLQVLNQRITQVIHLRADQLAESIAPPGRAMAMQDLADGRG